MKKLLFFCWILICCISCGEKEVTMNDLQKKGNVYYYKDQPYTGPINSNFKGSEKVKVSSSYKNGILDGVKTVYHENGQKQSEVSYVEGSPFGVKKEWYEDGQVAKEEYFEDGKRSPERLVFFPSGNKKMQIKKDPLVEGNFFKQDWYDSVDEQIRSSFTLLADKKTKHGRYELRFEDGELQEVAEYDNGKMIGEHKQWHPNGDLKLEENYSEPGKLDGEKTVWFEGGKKRSKELFKGGITLKQDFWYENGQAKISRGYDEAGLQVGNEVGYFDNGQVKVKRSFDDSGKKHGLEELFYENGSPQRKKEFVHGEESPSYTEWYGNGSKKIEKKVDDNGNGFLKTYFKNGNIKKDEIYKSGFLDGDIRENYESGKIFKEEKYVRGKREGKTTYWYETGMVKSESQFKNDKRIGSPIRYDENGKVIKEKAKKKEPAKKKKATKKKTAKKKKATKK